MKLKLVAILCALASSAFAQSGIRQFQIVSDNSQFPAPANVEWMQGESPQFVITAKQGNFYVGFSNGASVVLKAWAGNITTQLYAQKTGTVDVAASGKATVELLASEANFTPTGRYNYAVGVYDGTNYMGVIAQGVATVRGHPFGNNIGYVGTTSPFPYVPTNDANFLGAITGAYIAGQSGTGNVAKVGRRLALTYPAGGGGVGTFTNVTIGTNSYTAQVEIQVESNIVLRASGGTNYFALANTLAGNFTFNGTINANDNIEIANTKHLRFQDGGGTNTVHLAATAGRLIVTGAVDVVTGQAVPFTVNGIAPLYVQSETNAEARLASNVWAAADSTTNYVARTGDTMTGNLTLTSATIKVKSDSVNAEFTDARGAAGVLLQTGSPSASTNVYGVVKLQDSGPSAGYGTLYFDSRVSPTGLWIKASGTNRWNVWDQRNDGSGSGLDADLLDGLDSAYFSTSYVANVGGTMTGGLTNNVGFFGNGAGLTNLPIIGGASATTNAFVHFNLGAIRNATNNGMGLARGYLDTSTATNDIFPAFFITVSSNVVQDGFANALVRWPVASPTQITVRVWYQGQTNGPLEARFSNGTNAVAYTLGAATADAENTINLTPSGFLTNVLENAAVQLRISAAFASTSSVPMGRGIIEGIWVRR
jgi:hypothetical protein